MSCRSQPNLKRAKCQERGVGGGVLGARWGEEERLSLPARTKLSHMQKSDTQTQAAHVTGAANPRSATYTERQTTQHNTGRSQVTAKTASATQTYPHGVECAALARLPHQEPAVVLLVVRLLRTAAAAAGAPPAPLLLPALLRPALRLCARGLGCRGIVATATAAAAAATSTATTNTAALIQVWRLGAGAAAGGGPQQRPHQALHEAGPRPLLLLLLLLLLVLLLLVLLLLLLVVGSTVYVVKARPI